MAALSIDTERLLTEFAGKPGVTTEQVTNLRSSITNSPPLARQVDAAIASGHLQNFALLPSGANAGGTYDRLSKSINLPASILAVSTPSEIYDLTELTFVLGHEVQHGFNDAATELARTRFETSLRVAATGSHDYTDAIDRLLATNRHDEAVSNIEGWNALIGMIKAANPDATLADIYASNDRTKDFLEMELGPPITYTPHAELMLNSDMSITATAANIEGMAKHYFDKPARESRLGHHGNSDYQNYYGAYAVGRASQYEALHATPGVATRMTINMTRLGLQESLLEQNGIWLGEGTPAPQPYYDSSAHPPTLHHFDHTASTYTHLPIDRGRSGDTVRPYSSFGLGTDLDPSLGADRALHEQIRGKVAELDAANGRAYDATSERLTASLLVVAKDAGLERVDHVVLSEQVGQRPAAEHIFVVQGALADPAALRAAASTAEAAQRPMQESLDALAVINQRQADAASQEQSQRQAQEQQRGALSH